jgi:spore coat polysaccharide biosynthesis protein SpsF (cytidylyltransferase family)
MTSKKRGPVPKPKGIAQAFVCEYEEIPNVVKNKRYELVIKIISNDHADINHIRKAVKKSTDKFFNEIKNDR